MDDYRKIIQSFISEIASIQDITMRAHRFSERIVKYGFKEISYILHEILKGNAEAKPKHRMVYISLIRNRDIISIIGYDEIVAVYDYSKQQGFDMVTDFLKGSTVRRKSDIEAQTSPLSAKLKHLTLGEKKALARQKDYDQLEFLLFDNDPVVIENILLNPKLTEEDVIKVASNKASPREVLEVIFKSNKWISRYRIKKALVFNNNTPIDISLNLCNFLLKKDLKFIIKQSNLDTSIVERAKSVLIEKD